MQEELTISGEKIADIKKILITGGAGYLGTYAANYFLKKGYRIRILDICNYTKDDYNGPVAYFNVDIKDYNSVQNALQGVDIVIHAAAVPPFKKKQEISLTTLNGTRNVLEAAKKNNVKRVIFISSTAVYGIHSHMPIYEDSGYRGITNHARSKIMAERLCETYRDYGLNVTILRPTPLIGEGRLGIFSIFYDWIKENKKIPIIGNGQNLFQFLDTEDLCEAMQAIINAPVHLVNDNFNIGAKVFGTINEDLGGFINEVKSKSRLVYFPGRIAKIILKICEKIKISPVYEGVYGIIDKDLYFSIEKITKKLNWHPKSSNIDALIKAYKWYLSYGKNRANLHGNSNNKSVFKQGIISLIKKLI